MTMIVVVIVAYAAVVGHTVHLRGGVVWLALYTLCLLFGVGLMVASKSSLEAAETFNEKVYVIHRTGPHRVKRARHHTPPYTPHRATQLDAVYAELFTEGVEPSLKGMDCSLRVTGYTLVSRQSTLPFRDKTTE